MNVSSESLGIHHFNFTVSDIERTVGFYTEVLGFELVGRSIYTLDEQYATALLGGITKGAIEAEVASLVLGGLLVEFEQFRTPETVPYYDPPNTAGSAHIALRVANVDAVRQRLEAAGIQFSYDTVEFLAGGEQPWRFCYFWDPDHIMVELVEEVPLTDVVQTVGVRIRDLRKESRLTLKQLAERTGLSVAHVSQVERGGANPSLPNLISIARALGVLPESFLSSAPTGISAYGTGQKNGARTSNRHATGLGDTIPREQTPRAFHRGAETTVTGSVSWQCLTGQDDVVELVKYRYDAGASMSSWSRGSKGTGVMSVLEGCVHIYLNDVSHIMSAGTSQVFDRSATLRVVNESPDPAIVILAGAQHRG